MLRILGAQVRYSNTDLQEQHVYKFTAELDKNCVNSLYITLSSLKK